MADLGREAAPASASDLQDIRLLGADHATTLSNTIEANEDASSMWFGFIPHEEMDPEYIDSVIANQMYQISDSDRKLAYLDVHGVAEPIEETQALVEGGLNQLERELKTLSGRAAYDLAESMDPTYTQKRDLRIAFLRTELFDGKKAALRIRRHFQMKLEFFGRDKLVMDITQDDLGKDDMGALYSGCCHVLESRDRGGRKVLLNVTPKSNRFPTHSLLRRGFYNAMVAARDPVCQRRGAVNIFYFTGDETGSNILKCDTHWKLPKLTESIPIRIVATHLCYNDRLWRPIHSLIKTSLSLPSRIRLRTHHGSHSNCLARLRGHGIEPNILPVTEGGELKDIEHFMNQLEKQRRQERLTHPPRSKISVPSTYDVLFGKGTPVQAHLGNKKLRVLVLDCQKKYEKIKKGEKIILAQEIVDTVYQSSGKFLKPDGDGWLAVDNEAARNKVSTAFRTLRMDQRRTVGA